ncbi:MAG TPA: HAMP domain-containing sensor histidine kinase [Thermoanaerobaculia bacterium]|nr:HAMP domain-containing sensor histidine kinase [Thermoanaerobaculia bacterium]
MQMTASSSSNDSAPPEGIALVCAKDGTVRRVVLASLEGAAVRDSLCASADDASQQTCVLFVRSIDSAGFSRSSPLRLGSRDVHCYGFASGDDLFVVAVIDPANAAPFAEHVAGAHGQPPFHALAQEIRRTQSTYELYEQLARVNNELVTAQRELARTVAELKRLNAYKDELLGVAAHDLRNPLNANAAFITFLIEDAEQMSDNNLVLLDRLRANSTYMLRLVDDVLDFSAIEAGHVRLHLEESALDLIVSRVIATMRILAEVKQVEVRYTPNRDLPPLQLDRIKMSQAVQNVVSNAVQYSPQKSAVDVRLIAEEGFVTIEVEDRGPGIPPEEREDLFKPFKRLSTVKFAKQRSVGLGLAITRRLVEAHGGTIAVESEVGKGSIFRIRLKA